ncbi:MAG: LysM peptidoglycan-binding domain-containing protein [Actinobacteria bacterium]|nr:LysM peptidoglycan-binding domain-containing protein [Actinomycetota bacterium]
MTRRLRGVGALVVLGTALFGAPVALVRWGRFPSGWSALTRPDDGTLVLGVLTAVGWLAWAAFTASVAVEVVALATRSRGRLRLPLPGWLQQVSAGLVLAVVALGPSAVPSAPAPSATAAPRPEPEPAPVAAPAPAAEVDESVPTYLVQAGDDLWTVSERTLGAGGRWRDLRAANPELLQDPTAQLTPGTRLRLPATGTRSPRRVTVERGDTLSELALDHLGAAGRWPRIAAANSDLIDDPDHIEVGWRLVIPGSTASTHRVSPESRRDEADSGQKGEEKPEAASPSTAGPDSAQEPDTRPAQRPDTPPAQASASPGETPGASHAPEPATQDTATAGTQSPSATPSAVEDEPAEVPGIPLPGLFGTLAAAAILGVVETRRFLRLRERPVGRRLIPPDESASRLRSILVSQQRPDRLAALDAALRAIGRHCHANTLPLPELERITVGSELITIDWVTPAFAPPPGFGGTDRRWTIEVAAPPEAGDGPCPYPAVVSLGSTPEGELVLVDVERSRVLGVASTDAELGTSSIAAMAVELACAPWSAEAHLVVVGPDAPLVLLAGGDRVRAETDAEAALVGLRTLVARRRAALADRPLAELRVDPDRADAVAPVVLCLLGATPARLAAELDVLLAGPASGVAAILVAADAPSARWLVGGDTDAPSGQLAGAPGRLFAHAIPEATRAGVAGLLRAADDPSTTPAPWWGAPEDAARDNVLTLPRRVAGAEPGGDEVDIVRLVAATAHPEVLLIGPTGLRGAPGPEPTRSRQQLIEACTWLVEHPGTTATAMSDALMVAESTRRSNLSRLRTWLGVAPDGTAYLPDAYSGRIFLHPGVTSDWQRLQALLAPGVDQVGEGTLVAALDLVRGAPLADAAPSQWHWAEELRTDISCALRDVGLVLADRALARGDIDLARWAASRALTVAAEDEQLMCARIRTEHRAGNAAEVERLVTQVTLQARALEVDLLPETVRLCQEVIEGRQRARA